MATLDEIRQERQRISERLAQLDAERTKLSDQLDELETAERVMTRFSGKADSTKGRKTGHPAGTTPATPGKHRVPDGRPRVQRAAPEMKERRIGIGRRRVERRNPKRFLIMPSWQSAVYVICRARRLPCAIR